MATGSLYGSTSESTGLYGIGAASGGTYFEWFVFQDSATAPPTPTGGSWNFSNNTGTPPTGWVVSPPPAPVNQVWVSIVVVDSRNVTTLSWSVPGLMTGSGLPILSASGVPASGTGLNGQLYINTATTPQSLYFKQSGAWTQLSGSNLVDLVNNQTIGGVKTFTQTIQGDISGTAGNVSGVVAVANGGTGASTAANARTNLGLGSIATQNANAVAITGGSITGITDLAVADGGTGASSASVARTNLGAVGLSDTQTLTNKTISGASNTLTNIPNSALDNDSVNVNGVDLTLGAVQTLGPNWILPSYAGNAGKVLAVNPSSSDVQWVSGGGVGSVTSVDVSGGTTGLTTSGGPITAAGVITLAGTLAVANGGTGVTTSTGTGSTVLSTSPALTTPSINLINDTNGNEILSLSPVASATDYLTVKNGIGVGVPLHIQADGPSANIGLHIQPKGTGLVTISDGTDFNKGIRFRSSGSAAGVTTLIDAVSSAGHVVTLPDANTTLVGRNTTDTLTNKTFGDNPTFSAGTANAVAFLNGSKVLTTGSALYFDGSNLGVGTTSPIAKCTSSEGFTATGIATPTNTNTNSVQIGHDGTDGVVRAWNTTGLSLSAFNPIKFTTNGSEQMRLTSTGLGIGTSSPSTKLDVEGTAPSNVVAASVTNTADSGFSILRLRNTGASGRDYQIGVGGNVSGQNNNLYVFDATASAVRLTLDSSGNLGLGVTPSAWGSSFKAMQIGSLSGMSLMGYSSAAEIGNNFYFDTAYRYAASTSASRYVQSGSVHAWYTAPSGTAGNAISFTQAMTLDASGNLGVGTTSPGQKVECFGTLRVRSASQILDISTPSGRVDLNNLAGDALSFSTGSSERARITSGGQFVIGSSGAVTSLASGTLQVGSGISGLTPGTIPTAIVTSGALEFNFDGVSGTQRHGRIVGTAGSGVGGAYGGGLNLEYYAYDNVSTYQWYTGLSLDAGGNVGIGTSSPIQRLDVASSNTAVYQAIRSTSSGATNVALLIQDGTTGFNNGDGIYLGRTGAVNYLWTYENEPWVFATNNTERARITSGGFFGLGTSSPVAMFDLAGDYKEGVVTANTGTAYTINTATGTLQILTLTGNCTFTFPTATTGESFTLFLRQDGTGSRTVTWPANVRWPGGTAPTITSTASRQDKYVFTADGTNWYGSNAGQNYTV